MDPRRMGLLGAPDPGPHSSSRWLSCKAALRTGLHNAGASGALSSRPSRARGMAGSSQEGGEGPAGQLPLLPQGQQGVVHKGVRVVGIMTLLQGLQGGGLAARERLRVKACLNHKSKCKFMSRAWFLNRLCP